MYEDAFRKFILIAWKMHQILNKNIEWRLIFNKHTSHNAHLIICTVYFIKVIQRMKPDWKTVPRALNTLTHENTCNKLKIFD